MEQTIWILFGILAVIVGFALIFSLANHFSDSRIIDESKAAISKLQPQCDFVCRSPSGTRFSTTVSMPSGAIFFSDGEKICFSIGSARHCERCACTLEIYRLDLNSTLAKRTFSTHDYRCSFEKQDSVVVMDCQG
ncbi:MAG: hypothetical protein ABIF10_07155 [Candidatus Woesearchaeota archaeon]